MEDQQYNRYQEILNDAEDCPRLTKWEEQFITSMRERFQFYGKRTELSSKQVEAFEQIEQKVYASG